MYVLTVEPYHDNSQVIAVSVDRDALKLHAESRHTRALVWTEWGGGIEAHFDVRQPHEVYRIVSVPHVGPNIYSVADSMSIEIEDVEDANGG